MHHEVSLGCCSRNPASSLVRGISAPHEVLSPLPVVTYQRRLLHIDMRRRNDDYGMLDSGWSTTAAHMPEDDFLDCEKNRQLIDTLVRWCCAYYHEILSFSGTFPTLRERSRHSWSGCQLAAGYCGLVTVSSATPMARRCKSYRVRPCRFRQRAG